MLLSNWNKNYDKLLIKIDFDDDLPQCFLLSISSKLENEFTEIWLQTKLIQFYNSILFKVRKMVSITYTWEMPYKTELLQLTIVVELIVA